MNHHKTLTQRISSTIRTGATVAALGIPTTAFVVGTVESANPFGGVAAVVETAAVTVGLATGTGAGYKVCDSYDAQCKHLNKIRHDARKALIGWTENFSPTLHYRLVEEGYEYARRPRQLRESILETQTNAYTLP